MSTNLDLIQQATSHLNTRKLIENEERGAAVAAKRIRLKHMEEKERKAEAEKVAREEDCILRKERELAAT
eukprot:6577136-Ditylum_brightwellii.AAC.1